MVLLFLMFFLVYSIESMEQKKIVRPCSCLNTVEFEITKMKQTISFTDLNATLNAVTALIENVKIFEPQSLSFLNHEVVPQWKEVVDLKYKPKLYSAVGNLIAWCNAEKPKICYLINQAQNSTIRKIKVKKPIKFFDIAPDALSIAFASDMHFEVWNIETMHQVYEGVLENKKKESCVISAVAFCNYNEIALGMNKGIIHTINFESMKRLSFGLSQLLAVVALSCSMEGALIAGYEDGSLIRYQKYSNATVDFFTYDKKIVALRRILSQGVFNWIACNEEGVLFGYELKSDLLSKMYEPSCVGDLLGTTLYDTYVVYKAYKGTHGSLKHYSKKMKLLAELPVLETAIPVFQKKNLYKPRPNQDWIPVFIINKENDGWTLLSKQEPTSKQLAFKLMLVEAYKQKNSDVINRLCALEEFKTFGSYMQRLFTNCYTAL